MHLARRSPSSLKVWSAVVTSWDVQLRLRDVFLDLLMALSPTEPCQRKYVADDPLLNWRSELILLVNAIEQESTGGTELANEIFSWNDSWVRYAEWLIACRPLRYTAMISYSRAACARSSKEASQYVVSDVWPRHQYFAFRYYTLV